MFPTNLTESQDSEQRRYNFIADHYPGAGEREKLSVIAECERRLRISADGALHESSGFSQQAVTLDRTESSAEFIERYSLSLYILRGVHRR